MKTPLLHKMNKLCLCLAIVLSLAYVSIDASPYVYTERSNWHISVSGAVSIPTSSNFDVIQSNGLAAAGEINWDNGPAVMVAGGYTWNNWRFEVEYGFRKTDVAQADFMNLGNLTGNKNEVTYHSIMFDVSYDTFIFDRLYWYNGLGLGVAFSQFHSSNNFDDTDVNLAYQMMTGLGYKIMDNVDIYGGYRLFRTTGMEFTNKTGGTESRIKCDPPWINQIEGGIRVRF